MIATVSLQFIPHYFSLLGKEIYLFDYSEFNRFHLQSAKWKSNVHVLLLEKYDILILKIRNHNVAITSSFYSLQVKEAIHKRPSIHPEM